MELTNVFDEAALVNKLDVVSVDVPSDELVEKTIAYSLPEVEEPLLLDAETVTTHVAEALPHLTVIVAVPAETAVTFPLETVATEELDVDHVTVPDAVAVNVALFPSVRESVDLLRETESVVVEPLLEES